MASITKVGNKWRAEVRTKGAYKCKSHDTKAAAQRWAMEYEQSVGKRPAGSVSYTLGQAMDKYAQEISPARKGHRWEVVRIEKIKRDKIAHIMVADLTRDDFDAWVQRQTISGSSINRELNLLSAILKTARLKWKWICDNPMTDVERPKPAPHRDRLVAENEKERLLLALEYEEAAPVVSTRQEIAVAFLLALETAMRQGEIWGLEWDRVYLKRCFLRLDDTKNGTRRDVPLSARAVELLQKLGEKETGRVFKSSQSSAGTIFRRAVDLAGIENLTFHDSRHTAITALARKIDVLDLARMVGHKDIRSLMIYYNATAEDIAKRL